MPDSEKLSVNKDRILSTINIKGPSLPVQISKVINTDPLFASAILADLKSEQKLVTSNMKVGSSPLYFKKGQEHLLENFIQYLNSREKEAFNLIKDSKLLQDEKQSPILRVALRSLKDFAIPVKIRVNQETKLFWRYFLTPESEIKSLINNKQTPAPKEKSTNASLPNQNTTQLTQSSNVSQDKQIIPQTPTKTPVSLSPSVSVPQEKTTKSPIPTKPQKNLPKSKLTNEFPKQVLSHLQSNDIELLETISQKKREIEAKIRIDTIFGKQSFYLIAKDKKKITENDLSLAFQKAQQEKLPALIISSGQLDKKAQEHIKLWSNLIKFEKLK